MHTQLYSLFCENMIRILFINYGIKNLDLGTYNRKIFYTSHVSYFLLHFNSSALSRLFQCTEAFFLPLVRNG